MCGFIVAYGNNLKKKIDFKKFKNVSSLIKHRGPDFYKHEVTEDFFLFHSRLSIVDLDGRSNQPFYSENNRYILVYNGEIYNYLEIKKTLKNKYNFKTSSDTEVLLAAYVEWGKDLLKYIDGMFSFVIIDKKEKNIFIARDHFGQKPLYYHLNKDFILISSEIKPLLKLVNEKEFNYKTFSNYLTFNFYAEDKNTFFKSINQLKPGHFGLYKNNELKTFDYALIEKEIGESYKPFDCNELISILTKSSNDHLMGDVDVGLAVSSGLDSLSLLGLIMNSPKSKKLTECFTLDYGENFSEFDEAKKSISQLGMKTNRVVYTPKEMVKDFEKLVYFNEAPIGGVMHLGMSKLCKFAKQKGIKVLFNGTGLDEVLLGYKSSIQMLEKKNKFFKRDLTLIDGSKVEVSKLLKIKSEQSNVAHFHNLTLDLLMISKLPKNLHMLDRASMMHSVEMRNPFVSLKIVKYFLNLSYKNFYKKKLTKIPLRDSMQKIYPKLNWYNQKKYIQTPQNNWLREKKSKEFFGDIINSKNKFDDEFFVKKEIKNYWDKFIKNKLKVGFPIWQYTNLYFIEKIKFD